MEDQPKKVVKIKVTDKRRASEAPSDAEKVADPGGPSDRIGELSDTGPSGSNHPISSGLVSDNSLSGLTGPPGSAPRDSMGTPGSVAGDGRDFLDDLKRLQAEFDNYRKRTMRESAAASDRGTARVIEELLPVLDNFERAIAHGEGGEGVQLVFKDLSAALERLGLEEIPAEGAAFDPNVHEAMELRDTEGLEEPTVIEVYRRGYMLKDRLIRPASVVVGRPTEGESE